MPQQRGTSARKCILNTLQTLFIVTITKGRRRRRTSKYQLNLLTCTVSLPVLEEFLNQLKFHSNRTNSLTLSHSGVDHHRQKDTRQGQGHPQTTCPLSLEFRSFFLLLGLLLLLLSRLLTMTHIIKTLPLAPFFNSLSPHQPSHPLTRRA